MKPAQVAGATSSPANDDDGDTIVRVEVVGLGQEEAEQAEELGLLKKTEAPEVQALEDEDEDIDEEGDEDDWTSKDYAIGGLLAAILAVLATYTVLRYRNRI